MKLLSIDPSGMFGSIMGPVIGLISLGVTVQSKRNEERRENESAERALKQNLKVIRNSFREAGENFEEISKIIKSIANKYDNKILETKFRSGVHLIMTDNEAKDYIEAKRVMDSALCSAMRCINGTMNQVLLANPKSASCFVEIVGVLEGQINDLFSMQKTYEEVIEGTRKIIETINQRLSEMIGNSF